MMHFVRKVNDYIASRMPQVAPGDGIVVGLSGGADSVALAAVLTSSGYRCVAVHCNYGLRGDESERDSRVASEVASLLGCPIVTGRFDVSGNGVEEQCRQMRYELFERVRRQHDCRWIAVGHHLEDNIETFVFNALRGGASLRSLKAMMPVRDNIIRPLLACTRTEIEEYLRLKRLPWITDSSNHSDDYARNRIRHHVVPAMQSVKADAVRCLSTTIDTLQSNYTLMTALVDMARQQYMSDGQTDVARLCRECPTPARLLFELYDRKLSMTQANNIVEAVESDGTRRFGDLLLENGILSPAPLRDRPIRFDLFDGIPGMIESSLMQAAGFKPERDNDTIWLDADSLADDREALLRPWREGDRLQPFGMKGSRLVSDIFTDAHARASARAESLILEYTGKILWVAGYRASRHHAVTPTTQRILRLRFIH